MEESSIKKYNFESAKNQIERLLEELPSAPTINKVEVDGGLFGWSDHKVTGSEFNNRISKVQTGFIDINTSLHTVIKEFGAVYEILDILDNKYISSIKTTMEDLEKTCKKVLDEKDEGLFDILLVSNNMLHKCTLLPCHFCFLQFYIRFFEFKKRKRKN